jgi:DNA (cytosine-5)-methyltransferase 1
MRIASLFTGLGGLDLGFMWEGFKVVWANDILREARSSYELNFGFRPSEQDANDIDFGSLPDAELAIGGPPCQAFSLVGQRKPDDPRGRLVFKFLEAVEKMDPEGFVLENVPGMAASRINGVRLPDLLTKSFERLDYKVTQAPLIATDYLVPQLRRRLFILGSKHWKPEAPPGPLFARQVFGIEARKFDLSARAAIGDLGGCTRRGERAKYRETKPSQFARLMRSGGLTSVSLHECPRMSKTDRKLVRLIPPGGNYRDIPDSVSTGRILKFKMTGGRTTTYGRLHPDKPAYTINTYFRRPNVGSNFHYSEPRLITAREAMRFQSIPDRIEIVPCAQDTRNSLIGNAVPPLMARAVAWSMRKALIGEPIAQQRLA